MNARPDKDKPLVSKAAAHSHKDAACPALPFSNWLIASKVAPIHQPAFLISRQALNFAQADCLIKTVTLLEAPGGHGKSTLLAQWRDRLMAEGHKVGWLFLDEDDNSPAILLTYIIFALIKGGLPASNDLRQLLENLPDLPPKIAIGMLLNILANSDGRILLILDDFDILDDATINSIIMPLIRLAPANFHILIGSRKRPRLAQPQLYAQGRLQEIRAAELRFSQSEIEEVFQNQLSKADLHLVEELTQGWPIALQLLRSWIQQDPARLANVADISGLTEEIIDYLSEQVVQTFPQKIRTILMEAAVLHQLSARDIREICGSDADWTALLNCEPLRPFLRPHVGGDTVYRLHPILKEYLLLDLAQTAPARKTELHRKAALWYAETGRLLPSIRQADQARDFELEAQIIEAAGGVQIWLRHGLAITKSVNRQLSPELLKRCPRLALLRALVLLKEGRMADARALFQKLREETANFTLDRAEGDPDALRTDALMVEATLLINDCRAVADDYLSYYEKFLGEMYQENDFYAGHVKTLLCLCYHQRGHFGKARTYGRKALEHYTREHVWHGAVFVHLHLGVIAFAQGKSEAAAASYLEAKALTQSHFSSDRSKPLLIHPLMAELHYERNELTAARHHIANAIGRLQTTESWIDIYASASLTAASIAYIDKGIKGAMGIISKAQQDAENRGLLGLEKFLHAAEILFLARAGLKDRAAAIAVGITHDWQIDNHLSIAKIDTTWRELELVFLARAALALRSNRPQDTVAELGAIAPHMRQSDNIRSYIRIGAVQAGALYMTGKTEQSFDILNDVLSRCRETGYVRIFYDEHEILNDALKDFVRQSSKTGHYSNAGSYAKTLLKNLTAPSCQPQLNRLTPRELTVLQQLKEGYQDKMIARLLNMTENTVKYHLKSIYSKLQVSSRTEAVREAQRKTLIS